MAHTAHFLVGAYGFHSGKLQLFGRGVAARIGCAEAEWCLCGVGCGETENVSDELRAVG